MTRFARFLSLAAFLTAWPTAAQAQVLYSENFDVDHSANWTTNAFAPAAGQAANYFFDYSTVGIPSAPGAGGTTRGLKLEANLSPSGVFSGISVSPTGQSFLGDYRLRFNAWQNFIGPAPAGGSGSTQVSGGGIGTNGTSPQFYGGANAAANLQGVLVGITGDSNSSADFRAYTNVGAPLANVYGNSTTIGTNATDASGYWTTNFPGAVSPPAAQTALFPSQTGLTAAGCVGFAWNSWEIAKTGNTVVWTVNGILVATIDISGKVFDATNANIFLGHWDINAGSSTDTNGLTFGLIDNVSVQQIPEPGSLLLAGLAAPVLLRLRRKRKV